MPASRTAIVATGVSIVLHLSFAPPALAGTIDKNMTGLPTYPRLDSALMDPVPRDYQGTRCIHYSADSTDKLEAVEAWYRHAFTGAKQGPPDEPSLYHGIKLTRGRDQIVIYRFGTMKSTSIDLFKAV